MAFIPDEAIDRMTELSAGAWRLYCFLARYRNQKTGKCCPSAQTLARVMDVERRHIFRLKNELAEAGWAQFNGGDVTGLFGFGGDKNVTSTGDKNVTAKNVTSAKNVTPESPKCHPPVTKMSLAYKEEPANRTSKHEPAKERHVSSPVLEVFIYWQAAMNHPQAKLTPKRRRNIHDRLKEGYTVTQIQAAIDGCRASPFHMGQNDRATVYDDVELICRSGEKLESFIGRKSNNSGRLAELSPQGRASVAAGQEWVKQKQEEFERTGKV